MKSTWNAGLQVRRGHGALAFVDVASMHVIRPLARLPGSRLRIARAANVARRNEGGPAREGTAPDLPSGLHGYGARSLP